MKEIKKPKKPLIYYYSIVLIVLLLFNVLAMPWLMERQIKSVDYNTFISMTEEKDIGQVQISTQDNTVTFTDKEEEQIYKTAMVDDPDLTSFGIGKSNAKVYVQSTKGIKFSDVAGEDEAKENLAEIVQYLHDPDQYKEIGASMPKGILLVGPPGTGKTMLAKAVAGESNVPFFSISGSEFVEMFVGMGASKVRDLFRQAKEKAPCIVFIDEIDAIGQKRSGRVGGNDEREQTLNQLLTEMDGFEENNGVIILAATNRPESLDPALLRPGRFDRRVPVELPDLKGREEILKVHARKVKVADNVDYNKVARMASGALGYTMQVDEGNHYLMSKEFDMVAMEVQTNQYLGGDSSLICSAQTQRIIDEKVVETVKKQHEKAAQILLENRDKLDELSQYLYHKETITGEEFMKILHS